MPFVSKVNNTGALFLKGQSSRRLGSFNVCSRLLQLCYQFVVASTLSFAAVWLGGTIKTGETNRLDKLVKQASTECKTGLSGGSYHPA